MRLIAELKEVSYTPLMTGALEVYDIGCLAAGALASKGCCCIKTGSDIYGFSQWLSPKRTRSFPYARVYNTLSVKNRLTLIPFCKDEGFDGDRDFIQWDTVSLMSLLNVHVIIGFYASADKSRRPLQHNRHKITNQRYDYGYVARQIAELRKYQSSALHWNLKQMDNLHKVAAKARDSYANISEQTGVKLHGAKTFNRRIDAIKRDVGAFKEDSRESAREAQRREMQTLQPKEKIAGDKASIELHNLLGGCYFLTADEYLLINDTLLLIEKKHSARKKIPSANDIKDAFIKMSLFGNISEIKSERRAFKYQAAIGLTSDTIRGALHSRMPDAAVEKFISSNKLSKQATATVRLSVAEARKNNFILFILNAEALNQQKRILSQCIGGGK